MSNELPTGKLMSGEQLMEALFTAEAKPSQRWLRTQVQRGVIKPVRIGGLVFFDETAVRRSLAAHNVSAKVRAKKGAA
jgi:hypothetical protein